jgi:transcriptional regulator with XRE-family HTH domain
MVAAANDPAFADAQRHFGARVKAVREQGGWRQDALAAAVGLSQQSLSQIETGRAAPRFATIVKLAAALEVPIESLFAFDTVGPADREHARAVRELLQLLRDQPAEVVTTLARQAKPLVALAGRLKPPGE